VVNEVSFFFSESSEIVSGIASMSPASGVTARMS
jgi:hypothetical protein